MRTRVVCNSPVSSPIITKAFFSSSANVRTSVRVVSRSLMTLCSICEIFCLSSLFFSSEFGLTVMRGPLSGFQASHRPWLLLFVCFQRWSHHQTIFPARKTQENKQGLKYCETWHLHSIIKYTHNAVQTKIHVHNVQEQLYTHTMVCSHEYKTLHIGTSNPYSISRAFHVLQVIRLC